jgi:hypothetical protein
MRLERVGVLLLAGDGEFFGGQFGGDPHRNVFACAGEAVAQHGVDKLRVADAEAFARVGHGLHTAGDDDLCVAGGDGLCGERTALRPELQTMLMVVAETESKRPVRNAAWRAGFCPRPVARTHPIRHSSICDASIVVRATASRMAMALSSTAEREESVP